MWQVLKVEEIIKPRMADEKRKMIRQVREETTETAIVAVKTKLREQAEAEAAAREEGEIKIKYIYICFFIIVYTLLSQ